MERFPFKTKTSETEFYSDKTVWQISLVCVSNKWKEIEGEKDDGVMKK